MFSALGNIKFPVLLYFDGKNLRHNKVPSVNFPLKLLPQHANLLRYSLCCFWGDFFMSSNGYTRLSVCKNSVIVAFSHKFKSIFFYNSCYTTSILILFLPYSNFGNFLITQILMELMQAGSLRYLVMQLSERNHCTLAST